MASNRWKAEMKLVDKGNLVAIGDVTLDEVIKIKQVKVISMIREGKEMMFVSLPKQKTVKEGKVVWNNVCKTLTPESRNRLEEAVMDSIKNELKKDMKLQPEIDVKIHPVNKGHLKAYAEIVYDGIFEIGSVKIVEGKNGLFVSYPSQAAEQGYNNLIYPDTEFTRSMLDNKVLDAYGEHMLKMNIKKESRQEHLHKNRR